MFLVLFEVGVGEHMLVGVVSGLVEVIHIELSDEGGKVVVLEEPWQNSVCKLIRLLHYEPIPTLIPTNYTAKLGIIDNVVSFHQKARNVLLESLVLRVKVLVMSQLLFNSLFDI